MKITFLGNFSVDYSTESHHLWTYRKLGQEVKTFQEGRTKAEDILQSALKSDLFVWTHTHGWNTPDMDKVLEVLKSHKIPTAGYHLDLWKGIKREADLNTDPYWNIEYFFTVDKGFIPDLKARGIKAYYLPAGVVEKECYMAQPDTQRFPHEIIFTGSKGYHPEWNYRPELIEWLQYTYGDRFGHYGGDGLGTIRGHDLNVLYASAKIVIGDTLCKAYNYPDYFSDRLFEVTGRGGFMIFPKIIGLEDYFTINNFPLELVTYSFRNFEQLKCMIDFWLKDENKTQMEEIRLRGFERTKKYHTYTNRLSKMLEIINGTKVN